MKRKSITVYTIIISAIFAFCVGFFLYNMANEYFHGDARAERAYGFVTDSIERNGDRLDFSHVFKDLDGYEAIYIEKDGKPVFSYPNEGAKDSYSTPLVKVYRKTIKSNDGTYTSVLAIYKLRPSVIFRYARFSFIVILIGTIFSLVLIFYFTLTAKKDAENLISSESESNKDENEVEEIFNENEEVSLEPNENSVEEDAFSEGEEKISEKDGISNENKMIYENSSVSETEKEYEIPSTPIQEEDSEEKEEQNEAKDIFSVRTGFLNESQLKGRLENELVRSASGDQELSLILVRILNISAEEDIRKIADFVLSENPFRNLIFDYKEDGFALIRKDMSVKDAEIYAEKLLQNINELFEGENTPCFSGISSRSGRILSNERLLTEAEEALRRSMEDGKSRVTAFHVDIGKYMEFIKNRKND